VREIMNSKQRTMDKDIAVGAVSDNSKQAVLNGYRRSKSRRSLSRKLRGSF